jgi:hypothetical protein
MSDLSRFVVNICTGNVTTRPYARRRLLRLLRQRLPRLLAYRRGFKPLGTFCKTVRRNDISIWVGCAKTHRFDSSQSVSSTH